MYTGPNIENEELIWGYDTGYGMADNGTSTRHYPGKPVINRLANANDFSSWTPARNSGSYPTIDTETAPGPFAGTLADRLSLPSDGSYPRIQQTITPTTTSTHTFSVWMKGESSGQGCFIGLFRNSPWSGASSTTFSLTTEWVRYTFSITPLSTGAHIMYIGSHNSHGGKEFLIYGAQLETGTVGSPFNAGTRSSTQSLIDLTRTTNIDVSNVSFDSTGQPDFDGTDDYIGIDYDIGVLDEYSFDMVYETSVANKMSISSKTQDHFYKWGATTWRYNHSNDFNNYFNPNPGVATGLHHWTITYNGSVLEAFQNGVSLGTRSSTGTANFYNGLQMGRWRTTTSYSWNGSIYVMKMYNKGLTPEEVKRNYKAYKKRFNI